MQGFYTRQSVCILKSDGTIPYILWLVKGRKPSCQVFYRTTTDFFSVFWQSICKSLMLFYHYYYYYFSVGMEWRVYDRSELTAKTRNLETDNKDNKAPH